MRLRHTYIILFLFVTLQASAQKNLLRYLASQKGSFELQLLNKETKLVSTPIGLTCTDSKHAYMVNNGQLYFQITGTGKLFKIDSTLGAIRLDNTCFEGYNFGAYSFVRNDKFYNLGGWGFWQFNSGLRYFDTTSKEWFRQPISKEVRMALHMNAVVYPDKINDLIYFIYLNFAHAYEKTDLYIGVTLFWVFY